MRKILFSLLLILSGIYTNCGLPIRAVGLIDFQFRAPINFQCPQRIISVAFDSQFSARERDLGERALLALANYGVQVRMVRLGTQDVLIKLWTAHDCHDQILGLHTAFQNFVLVDPGCISSEQQYQAVILHEIGHWLGMRHVCQPDGETPDGCSVVGRGEAILNPYLDSDALVLPSTLDIAEYNRACWARLYRN